MKKSWMWLLLFGASLYVLFLIAILPAQLAAGWWAPQDLRLAGVSGSAWRGHAGQALASAAYFEDLDWRFRPSRLLVGRIAFHVDAQIPDGGFIRGEIATRGGSSVWLRDLDSSFRLDSLRPLMRDPLDGRVALQIENAMVRDSWPEALSGRIDISGLLTIDPISQQPQDIGDYVINFDAQESFPITGNLKDADAPFNVNGTLTLSQERNLSLSLIITLRPDTPEKFRNAVRLIAQEQGDGGWRVPTITRSFQTTPQANP